LNILVTLDSNYINPLKVMLKSLFLNNQNEEFYIFLLHSSIKPEEMEDINGFITKNGHRFLPIEIKGGDFRDAPIVMHYTKEMYYRLLAFKYLPVDVNKVLYLDPDILIINNIRTLYDIDLSGWLYAAAYHNRIPVKEINKFRLMEYEIEEYFNSGVLLMNLKMQREKIKEKDIFEFVARHKSILILPDQDILNSLFAKKIKKLDEILYNYDTRYYRRILSKGNVSMDYIINNTIILHFCGKKKPWGKNYSGEFYSLYKHYERLAMTG